MTKSRIKFGALLAVMLIMSMALVPAVSAQQMKKVPNQPLERVDFDKSVLDFSDTLVNFETVVTTPSNFKKSADKGKVKLKLLGKDFDLELKQVAVQREDAKIIVENETGKHIIKAPKIDIYKGQISGEVNSSVLFTVADDVLLGKIHLTEKTYYIEQTNKKHDGKVIHVVYTTDMIKQRKILEYNTDGLIELNSSESLMIPFKEESVNLSSNYSVNILATTTVDLLAGYDTEFKNKFSNPTAEISNMLSSVNGAFSAASVSIYPNYYKEYSNVSNSDGCTVLTNFKTAASSDRDSTNSDLAFLFSGKEFTTSTIGCAKQYSGSSSSAYAVGQMVSAGQSSSYGGDYNDRTILITHELGHNFGAHHQTSTLPYAKAYSWDAGSGKTYYTAMWTPYKGISHPNYMQLEFSDKNNHGDSTHDNRKRVSETKFAVAGFQ